MIILHVIILDLNKKNYFLFLFSPLLLNIIKIMTLLDLFSCFIRNFAVLNIEWILVLLPKHLWINMSI